MLVGSGVAAAAVLEMGAAGLAGLDDVVVASPVLVAALGVVLVVNSVVCVDATVAVELVGWASTEVLEVDVLDVIPTLLTAATSLKLV